MPNTEIVYVLSNPAMPGIVKIGRTASEDANTRIAQLYTTGVPVPFKLEYACKVSDAAKVEEALHTAFDPYRMNPKREFFEIAAEQAIAILELLNMEEATQEVESQPTGIDVDSINAGEKLQKRRPRLDFEKMGIPAGAVLHFVDSEGTVTVLGPRKVRFGDEETSLTSATQQLLGIDRPIAPTPHWTYNGRNLRDIYTETYGSPE